MDLQKMETQMIERMSDAMARGDYAQGSAWDFPILIAFLAALLLFTYRADIFAIIKKRPAKRHR